MTRRSYICDPNPPYKLIPKEEYLAPERRAPHIMPDIEPFVSPVTGKLIRGRRDLRLHNREQAVTNMADFSPEYFKRKQAENSIHSKTQKAERIAAIKQAMEQKRG